MFDEYMKQVESSQQLANTFIRHFVNERTAIHVEKFMETPDASIVQELRHAPISTKGRSLEEVVREMEEKVYRYNGRVDHPRQFGFIPGPATSLSWLGDVMTNAYNPHAGGFALAPTVNAVEERLLEWLAEQIDYPSSSGGVFVSGGSMANLTALVAARDALLEDDTYHLGTAYVSDQTHSSVAKSLHVSGIRRQHIRIVPSDEQFRMDVEALEAMIQEDKERGLYPYVVIASSGTTNTGSIDPLHEIASICEKEQLWMHVDGAYGASIALSPEYRHLLSGIERSDSVSWDGHKWLFQTYGIAMVIVKDRQHLLNSYHNAPEYLQDVASTETQFNPWDLGIEMTRPARGLKLWLTLQTLGTEQVGKWITEGMKRAEFTEQLLRKDEEWTIVSPAQLAIINFRYTPVGYTEEQLDVLNHQISEKMLASGFAGVFTTKLKGKIVLRMVTIHPETTDNDIEETINRLTEIAKRLKK